MDKKALIKIGMTPIEAEIYLEILGFNVTTIGPIIKKTGLHRGTIYNSINNLMKKGFVSFVDIKNKRLYRTTGQKIFSNIIKDKTKEIMKEKKEIEDFFKDIEKFKKDSPENQIDVHYGINSFKSLFLEIYDLCKQNDYEYLFMGRGGEMQDATGEGFYRYTQKLKKKMKVRCRVILDKENVKHSFHKYVQGNIRYLPSKKYSPINIWIYGDFVLMILFNTNPLINIKVKSKELSDGFRNYFEALWEISDSKA